MTDAAISLPSAYAGQPMFLVGVTGYMKPDPRDVDAIREQVRNVLLFLRDGSRATVPPRISQGTENEAPTGPAGEQTLGDWLARQLTPPGDTLGTFGFYRGALQHWKPLKKTPIVVMSALAPGVDTIVAEEALKLEIPVIAPLPFPAQQYRDSSSLVWSDATDGENVKRQEKFDDLRKQIRPENVFHAPLADDLKLSPKDFSKLIVDDLTATNADGTPRRHERYYAAGEYIASYSHLMLAVWDGEKEPSKVGTSAVVLTRLQGPRPGVQPTTNDLALPNGGPLLHLYARKATKRPMTDASGAAASPAAPSTPALPAMRLLHPFSTETEQYQKIPDGDVIAPCQHTDRKLQRVRLSTFIRIASDLERFNSQSIPTWKRRDREKEFQGKRLVPGSLTGGEVAAKLPATNSLWTTALLAALRRISDLRCEATDANGLFAERANTTMRRLFMSTLFAAILLHVFAHWETHHCEEPHKKSSDAVQPAQTEPHAAKAPGADPHGNPDARHPKFKAPPVSPVRVWAGVLAFVFGIAGLVIFAIDTSRCTGEQRDDTRALGEGLRVQFYWNLAGLGRSVSANYMQRQRSELDWIRGVIRTVCIPYHWWADTFHELSARERLDALRLVHGGWIQEQLGYFRNAYHKRQHSLHGWHNLGFVSTLAGLFVMAACWAVYWTQPPKVGPGTWETLHKNWLTDQQPWLFLWEIIAFLIAGIWWLRACVSQYGNDAKALTARESCGSHDKLTSLATHGSPHKAPWGQAVLRFFLPKRPSGGRSKVEEQAEPWCCYAARCYRHWRDTLLELLMWLVSLLTPPWLTAARPGTKFPVLLARSLYNFATLIPVSLGTAMLTASAVLAIAEKHHDWPSAESLGIIAGGVLLLFGAMSIAWVEKNFDSELGYQYNNMAGLFQHANQRMTRLLSELEELHSKLEAAIGTTTENDARAKFHTAICDTQRFLYEVGVEALDENAEWLILHRARPLEPVLAG